MADERLFAQNHTASGYEEPRCLFEARRIAAKFVAKGFEEPVRVYEVRWRE